MAISLALARGMLRPWIRPKATFSQTGRESKSAPPWNSMPKRRRIFIAGRALQPHDFLAAHLDGAGIGAEDSEDAFQHHGFSGAGAADHHKGMALRHGEVDAVQHVLWAEALAQVLEDDVTVSHRSLRKQQVGEGEVGGENENGGGDHGIGGGAAHALRAALGIEAVVAAHDGDDEPEDGGLDEA